MKKGPQTLIAKPATAFPEIAYITVRAGFNRSEALGQSTCEAPSPIVCEEKNGKR